MTKLYDLLKEYIDMHKDLKDRNQHLHSFIFNKKFGLLINWPDEEEALIDHVNELILSGLKEGRKNVVFVYSDNNDYHTLRTSMDQNLRDICYVDWNSIYTAMRRVGEDARYLSAIKDKIAKASLVIVLGNHDITVDVIDQIRSDAEGCLILLNCM